MCQYRGYQQVVGFADSGHPALLSFVDYGYPIVLEAMLGLIRISSFYFGPFYSALTPTSVTSPQSSAVTFSANIHKVGKAKKPL